MAILKKERKSIQTGYILANTHSTWNWYLIYDLGRRGSFIRCLNRGVFHVSQHLLHRLLLLLLLLLSSRFYSPPFSPPFPPFHHFGLLTSHLNARLLHTTLTLLAAIAAALHTGPKRHPAPFPSLSPNLKNTPAATGTRRML